MPVLKVEREAGHPGANPEEEIAENLRWMRDGLVPDGASAPRELAGRSAAG